MAEISKRTLRLQTLLQYLMVIFFTLIVAYLIIEYFDPIIVSGNSMKPTLQNGDLVISTNTFDENSIEKGDIIVFIQDETQMIKRVVATPGDEIWIENGNLYVNGEISPYQFSEIEQAGVLTNHVFIHANEYFCMGDNHNESRDCREFGPIKFDQIKYKVILKNLEDINSLEDLKNILEKKEN